MSVIMRSPLFLLILLLLIPLAGVGASQLSSRPISGLQADFYVELKPDRLEVMPGEKAAFDIVVTTIGGFTGTLSFDVLSVPPYSFYEIKPSTGKLQLKIYTTENTPPGTYEIKLMASAGGRSKVATATLVVTGGGAGGGPDFRVALRPTTASISPGETAEFRVVLIPTGGFAETVHYTVSGIPPHSYRSMEVRGTDVILKVITTPSTPPGTYEIVVTATGGGKVRRATARLVVGRTATTGTGSEEGWGGGLSISVLPKTLRVRAGGRGIITVRVYRRGDFNAPVTIRMEGLPGGVRASADVNNTPPNFVSQIEVTVGAEVPAGSHRLDLIISGGGVREERNVTLVVENPSPSATATATATAAAAGANGTTGAGGQADFSVEVVPSSLSLQRGGSGSVAVTVRGRGLEQPVSLSVRGPETLSFTFSPTSSLRAGETASLMVRAGEEPGTYAVVIEGRSGNLVRTTTLTVRVEAGESRCIIATVTYGEDSEVVRRLRSFRDGVVMSTYSGSRFMTVFNAFYYSWSPAVAAWLRSNAAARTAVRAIISPLIAVLDASSSLFDRIAISELSVTLVGLVSSFLIGLIYLGPLLTLAWRRIGPGMVLRVCLIAAASLAGMLLALVLRMDPLMQVSSSASVLSLMALGALSPPLVVRALR